MSENCLRLSKLPKTWVIDVDGTIVPHNGHLRAEGDTLLPGVKAFFERLPEDDVVVFLTARTVEHRVALEDFLRREDIRFNTLLCGMPTGERILINDRKPSGLPTAFAVNRQRDSDWDISVKLEESL